MDGILHACSLLTLWNVGGAYAVVILTYNEDVKNFQALK